MPKLALDSGKMTPSFWALTHQFSPPQKPSLLTAKFCSRRPPTPASTQTPVQRQPFLRPPTLPRVSSLARFAPAALAPLHTPMLHLPRRMGRLRWDRALHPTGPSSE